MGHRYNFNQHHHQSVPKGCMAIKVGPTKDGQERFVVPLMYLHHPLFIDLLKEAEDEYKFNYDEGAITIPCHVAHFRQVQGMIEEEAATHLHHHHLFHMPTCFGGFIKA